MKKVILSVGLVVVSLFATAKTMHVREFGQGNQNGLNQDKTSLNLQKRINKALLCGKVHLIGERINALTPHYQLFMKSKKNFFPYSRLYFKKTAFIPIKNGIFAKIYKNRSYE